MPDLTFSKVVPTDDQINDLYQLLTQRRHKISHLVQPSLAEHADFVNAHPYRAWYIAYRDNQAAGSVYLSNDNTIGLNMLDDPTATDLATVITHLKKNYAPLPAIKSVRAARFSINVPPTNTALHDALKALGAEVLQTTYTLD